MQIYIVKDGQQAGPYEKEQLIQELNCGAIKCEDLVWADGMADWQPLSQFLSLQPLPLPTYMDRPGVVDPADIPAARLDSLTPDMKAALLPNEKPLHQTFLHWIYLAPATAVGILVFVPFLAPLYIFSDENRGLEFLITTLILLVVEAAILLPSINKLRVSRFLITNLRVLIRTGFTGRKRFELLISQINSVEMIKGDAFKQGDIIFTMNDKSIEVLSKIADPIRFCKCIEALKGIKNSPLSQQPGKATSDISWQGVGNFIWPLVAVVFILWYKPFSGRSPALNDPSSASPSGAKSQSVIDRVLSNSDNLAKGCAETLVSKYLKSPSTATFGEIKIAYKQHPWYQVYVEVDSQNGFGAYIRSRYICTLKLGKGNNFTYNTTFGIQNAEAEGQLEGTLETIRVLNGWPGTSDRGGSAK